MKRNSEERREAVENGAALAIALLYVAWAYTLLADTLSIRIAEERAIVVATIIALAIWPTWALWRSARAWRNRYRALRSEVGKLREPSCPYCDPDLP